jgi:hypothetical protein
LHRIILFFSLVVAAAHGTAAQNPKVEPGKPGELKGVVRIYLQIDEDRARQNIVSELQQQLPQLTLVEKPEDAQVILTFQQIRRRYRTTSPEPRGSVERRGSTRQIEPRMPGSSPSLDYEVKALGGVIKPVGPTISRRLLRFEDTLPSSLEGRLSIEFARAFIKVYRQANHK